VPDVVVIGAGVVGCALAGFLAEAGRAVTVVEREAIGAGASGRNSGLVEHPYDHAQTALFEDTVKALGELLGDAFPPEPVGTLLLVDDEAQAHAAAERHAQFVGVEVLSPDALRTQEPGLGDGLWACRVATGHPVAPALAVEALAQRAHQAGATFVFGTEAPQAETTVIAAGAASGALIPTTKLWPVWGVTVAIDLDDLPNHPLIDGRISDIQVGHAASSGAEFSLIGGVLGSTFLLDEPDPAAWVQPLHEIGRRFWPALQNANVTAVRACPRPRTADGRPYLGQLRDGRWLAAGHGGRGISTGIASARLVADAILAGTDAAIPAPLRADRLDG
jgi:glycine oxidase